MEEQNLLGLLVVKKELLISNRDLIEVLLEIEKISEKEMAHLPTEASLAQLETSLKLRLREEEVMERRSILVGREQIEDQARLKVDQLEENLLTVETDLLERQVEDILQDRVLAREVHRQEVHVLAREDQVLL